MLERSRRVPSDGVKLSEAAEAKRRQWNSDADRYQAGKADVLDRMPMAWGEYRIPESEVQVLGDVAGRDVLDYGCGAAEWSIALARKGARPIALDVSDRQLEHARRKMDRAGVDFPLVHAGGDSVPLPDASFDIVFSDGGVCGHMDPQLWLPETARLLRPGGLLAFSWVTAFAYTHSVPDEWHGTTLVTDLFGMRGIKHSDGRTHFTLPHGDAIKLFRDHGFEILDLIELQAPERALTADGMAELNLDPDFLRIAEWERHWPFREIWRLRKQPA